MGSISISPPAASMAWSVITAQKTTTLNALLGLTSYEGTVRVLGEDPYQKRAALMENVAFISDVASLPRFLRVRELFALISNIHPRFDQAKARGFLEGTDVKMEAKIKHLSKGMIAQLHLAAVMAIDAKLLVLDEPTLGLDITYRKRFYRRLLDDYRSRYVRRHHIRRRIAGQSDDGALVAIRPVDDRPR
ncbi:ATP-binding cassette domain-containing protein [Mesorhizobium sp. AR02]|uniref:ATP-binding cassette domain-containing protein n=1 Tax=Mesorhizobium sp. AR02 TaxID=2865837 RepID=UPI003A5C2A46